MPAMRTDTLSLLPAEDNQDDTTAPFSADHYILHLDEDACVIRAIMVESIDSLFPALVDAPETETADDPMAEPVLDCVIDQRVQFIGQMAAPPRAHRRQRLHSSRAVLHTTAGTDS